MAMPTTPTLRTATRRSRLWLMALGLIGSAAVSLAACDKLRKEPPAPTVKALPMSSGAASAGSVDASVPAADTVVAPAAAIKPDPTAGRTNSTMTRAQETSAMPLPGQNNDHSAPVSPAASAATVKRDSGK